ncbi:MAG: hypothetical protein WB919_18085 [Candidatus Sulfotelmatobacter sp.]
MDGNTPPLEANRIGCNVIGTDINPMAAWIVHEEIDAIDLKSYSKNAEDLLDRLAEEIGHLYKTRCLLTDRKDADVKNFLWVKTGTRAACRKGFDRFPGYVLAEDAPHTSYVLVCASCGDLNEVKNPVSQTTARDPIEQHISASDVLRFLADRRWKSITSNGSLSKMFTCTPSRLQTPRPSRQLPAKTK